MDESELTSVPVYQFPLNLHDLIFFNLHILLVMF